MPGSAVVTSNRSLNPQVYDKPSKDEPLRFSAGAPPQAFEHAAQLLDSLESCKPRRIFSPSNSAADKEGVDWGAVGGNAALSALSLTGSFGVGMYAFNRIANSPCHPAVKVAAAAFPIVSAAATVVLGKVGSAAGLRATPTTPTLALDSMHPAAFVISAAASRVYGIPGVLARAGVPSFVAGLVPGAIGAATAGALQDFAVQKLVQDRSIPQKPAGELAIDRAITQVPASLLKQVEAGLRVAGNGSLATRVAVQGPLTMAAMFALRSQFEHGDGHSVPSRGEEGTS